MDYRDIEYALDGGLATVTLNRPQSMNALTGQMRAEITHAMKRAAREARCVVLTGNGSSFCSGQDLKDAGTRENAPIDLERTLRDEYTPMLEAIYNCPVPTIAAVNGAAAGAGANLALAADVVIACDSAFFLQAFTRIGLMPDAGGTWYLPRQIGLAKAMGAALFAEKITAKDACDMGMIWQNVADDAFESTWRARAKHLAEGPTQAFGAIKTALRNSMDNSLQDQLDLEATLQGDLGRSRDFLEGVTAFVDKRPAKFEGR